MDTANRTAGITVKFETTDCSRCGGTGEFGPRSVNGGRCFSCAGSRVVLSRSGKAAKKRYDAIIAKMDRTVEDIEPGDIIQARLAKGLLSSATAWIKVTSVSADDTTGHMIETASDGTQTRIPFLRINFEPEPRLEGWSAPLTQPGFPARIWDLEVYREAAKAVSRLKGATVTGL